MATKTKNKTITLAEAKGKLTAIYDMLVKEAGSRMLPEDAARVGSIMAMCQELLGDPTTPDQTTPDQAMTPDMMAKMAATQAEAENVLGILKDQEGAKTEDGQQYPANAFAYAPDPEQPSGWKLRMWEDPKQKVTRRQLGMAAAALSPGGFRGNKVQIPDADLPAVKRKLRNEYKSLGVADEEIPRWVKEAEMRTIISDFVTLAEAAVKDGKAKVMVIKAGFNLGKDRYYPAAVLCRDFKIFEGVKMYADHPTADEDRNRPERSIRDFVAILSDVAVDEAGTVTGVASIVEPWLLEKLTNLQDKGMLNRMGISINAVASASKADVEGVKTTLVERLIAARSVDFVTEAGAGGMVLTLEADTRNDIDLIDLDALKVRRSDLVQALENEAKVKATKEAKQAMEKDEELKQLRENNTALTAERDSLKTAKEAADKAVAQATAKAAVEATLASSKLPDAAKQRIKERYAGAEKADGVGDAIKAEEVYIATVTEAAKVKNQGEPPAPDEKAAQAALKEAFIKTGMSEKAAEIAAKGRA